MAVVSDQTIASAAQSAGFPREELATAVAVALAESGGDATATNTNTDDTTDHGLWQINSIHEEDLAGGSWQDPGDNARMALAVWSRAGRAWSPWYAWRDGRHLAYLGRGELAARAVGESGAVVEPAALPNPFDAADQVEAVAGRISAVLSVLSDRDLWVRIGIAAAGVLVVVTALVALLRTLGERVATRKIGKLLKGKVGKKA